MASPDDTCSLTLGPGDDLASAIARADEGAVVCLKPGRYPGDLSPQRSLTRRGLGGAGEVTLDAAGRGRCVAVLHDDLVVQLEGLTLTGGRGEGGGGAALLGLSKLTLSDCVLTGNTGSQAPGGAVYAELGTLTLRRCRVHGNVADDGVAVLADQIASLVIEDSLLVEDVGHDASVVKVRDGVDARISRSTIVATGRGAAVHASGTTSRQPEVAVADSVLAGPHALDLPAPDPVVVPVTRSVLATPGGFLDQGGVHVGDALLTPGEWAPGPGSPALGIAHGGGSDLDGAPRPEAGAAAGALQR